MANHWSGSAAKMGRNYECDSRNASLLVEKGVVCSWRIPVFEHLVLPAVPET